MNVSPGAGVTLSDNPPGSTGPQSRTVTTIRLNGSDPLDRRDAGFGRCSSDPTHAPGRSLRRAYIVMSIADTGASVPMTATTASNARATKVSTMRLRFSRPMATLMSSGSSSA